MLLPDKINIEKIVKPILSNIYPDSKKLPGYLRISLLEACNEKCFFCHNEGYTHSRNKKIDSRIVEKVVDASLSLGKNKFKFTGGEPTIEPNLTKYIRLINEKDSNSDIGIVTNALRLAQLSEDLYDAGLSSIIVSLHSNIPEIYHKITKVNGFKMADKGIKSAQDAGIKDITINCVVSSINLPFINDLQTYCNNNQLKLRLLDMLPTDEYTQSVAVKRETLVDMFPDLVIKPKIFHQKCDSCSSKPFCGEGEYLRVSASNTLDPCMYRPDLKQKVNILDTSEQTIFKVALGYRRIQRDDM